MEKIAVVLATASIALGHADKADAVFGIDAPSLVPHEWAHHTTKFAPESRVERASRHLSAWMGFNKGNGFITVNGFSDDQCLHPIWETGANVGRCMMAVTETGDVAGSWRTKVTEKGGKFSIATEKFPGQVGCWYGGETHLMEKVSTKCHKAHTAIDGAGEVNSYQFSWTPHDVTPKLVSFANQFIRGRIEMDDMIECERDPYSSMFNITRYYMQKGVAMSSCYKGPEGTGGSYMTLCDDGHQGPGTPFNKWFVDDHCGQPMPDGNSMDIHMNMCYPQRSPLPQQTYGGARLFHSGAFGRMHGEVFHEMCFFGGRRYGGTDMLPEDKLAPWNTFKDISVPPEDNSGGGGNGMGCTGNGCGCNGDLCMTGRSVECSDDSCICISGSDTACTCNNGNGCPANAMMVNHCHGAGCHCGGGGRCTMTGQVHAAANSPNTHLECMQNGPNCWCTGPGCECNGDSGSGSCWCEGPDCGCDTAAAGSQCSMNDGARCSGPGCSCHGDDCLLLSKSHSTGPDAFCWGPHCGMA